MYMKYVRISFSFTGIFRKWRLTVSASCALFRPGLVCSL
uniref:Uncharacterized protein n=1 Tax=Anguilla anguilla TaxID=7936 RepID=A0A0E9R325_ANGAN